VFAIWPSAKKLVCHCQTHPWFPLSTTPGGDLLEQADDALVNRLSVELDRAPAMIRRALANLKERGLIFPAQDGDINRER
jgi:hypothetical protein